MRKFKFISFEGGEGSGKTSCWEHIESIAQKKWPDKKFVFINDPSKDGICKDIRNILLNDKNTNLSPVSELMLYLAARAQLTQDAIYPYIDEKDTVVISDRYDLSTYAYQTRDLFDFTTIEDLHSMMKKFNGYLIPDMTIWFDVLPKIGLQRSKKRLNDNDIQEGRIENMQDSTHEHIQSTFKDIYHTCNLTALKVESTFKSYRTMYRVDCNYSPLDEIKIKVENFINNSIYI